jgi:hypothetical protein
MNPSKKRDIILNRARRGVQFASQRARIRAVLIAMQRLGVRAEFMNFSREFNLKRDGRARQCFTPRTQIKATHRNVNASTTDASRAR